MRKQKLASIWVKAKGKIYPAPFAYISLFRKMAKNGRKCKAEFTKMRKRKLSVNNHGKK